MLAGEIVVSRLVFLCVQRHVTDLERGASRGLWFDEDAAQHAIDFFSFLRHSKGEWANQPFTLEPWQQFILWCIFGWKNKDGTRRFRSAHIEIARKNGKSTLLAGIGLYALVADGEPGAEVYSAATKLDQAKIIFSEAVRMVKASPDLSDALGVLRANIHHLLSHSKFEPLGADENTLDGLNVHVGLVDELHAHKTRGVYDLIETATGARRQPLIVSITTAGVSTNTICWEVRTHAVKVLTGIFNDDTVFAFIACLDQRNDLGDDSADDDWKDERNWIKANPNLGVSIKITYLRSRAEKAIETPTYENTFKRLHLNCWTEQVSRFIAVKRWEECEVSEQLANFEGKTCYIGLDLSTTTDISAISLIFPYDSGAITFEKYFLPIGNVAQKERTDRVPYQSWIDQGFITATPGEVIDYDFIRKTINELGDRFVIKEIGADPWNATQLLHQLDGDGFTVIPLRQTFGIMSGPTKELEKMILKRRLVHVANPVTRWMLSNLSIRTDAEGNIKPVKPDHENSTKKIDGMVSIILGLARAVLHGDDSSIYEERGVLVI